nr:hypothetical protein GCM10020092_064080 [Actinoplanes digitatis]
MPSSTVASRTSAARLADMPGTIQIVTAIDRQPRTRVNSSLRVPPKLNRSRRSSAMPHRARDRAPDPESSPGSFTTQFDAIDDPRGTIPPG